MREKMSSQDEQWQPPLKASRYLAFVVGIIGGAVLAIFWPVLKDAEARQELLKQLRRSWSGADKS
jgi:hypothetical protein